MTSMIREGCESGSQMTSLAGSSCSISGSYVVRGIEEITVYGQIEMRFCCMSAESHLSIPLLFCFSEEPGVSLLGQLRPGKGVV